MTLNRQLRQMMIVMMGLIALGYGQENSAPFADDFSIDILGDGPHPIVLNGNDDEGDAIYFPIVQAPENGVLGGLAGDLVTGEVTDLEAGPASLLYWMFDQDANPFDHSGVSVYAYTNLDWNADGHGTGGCDGTGLETQSQVFGENLALVDDINGLEIFLDDLVIESQEHLNTENPANPWTTLGEAGENRVYSQGIGNIKEDGVIKLAVVDMALWLKIYYPNPVGAGGVDGYASGFGVARIDQVNSDPAWIAAFDPEGTGWLEVAFESFSQTVQGCFGAYDIVGMSIRPMAGANLSYTPTPDFVGTDELSYVLFDGELFSEEIFVTLNVDASEEPPEGSGTELDPFQIADMDDLTWVSDHADHWDKFFAQTADIDAASSALLNEGTGFLPIGNSVTRFTGSYDGGGYTISALTMAHLESDHQGLFGYTDGATISYLSLIDVDISGSDYVGGLIGYNNASNLIHVYTSGMVSGNDRVGGLIGYNHGNIDSSSSRCSVSGAQDVGGMIGRSEGATLVQNSYAEGNAEGTDRVGGFIGSLHFSPAHIKNSYSRGSATRTNGDSEKVGSFAGSVGTACQVENSYSTGEVTYVDADNPTNKGFVGFDIAGSYLNNFWDIESSAQTTGNGAEAKTTLQMNKISTFTYATWDFEVEDFNGTDNDWDMDREAGIVNDGYPFLAWENGDVTLIQPGSTPTVEDMNINTGVDEEVSFLLEGNDADNDDIMFVLWDFGTDGGLELADSTVTYTPPAGNDGTDSFSFQAYDGLYYSAFATVTITIAEPNIAPMMDPIEPQASFEDAPLEVIVSASDEDGDELVYEASSDQDAVAVDLVGTTLTLTPEADWNGLAQITIIVTDDGAGNLADTTQFDYTVLPVNDPPQAFGLISPTDEAIVMDSLITLAWHPAEDIDSDGIYYLINIAGDIFELVLDAGIDTTLTISVLDMPRGTLLEWQVQANDSVSTISSNMQHFTVDESVGYVNYPPLAQDTSGIVIEDSLETVIISGTDGNLDSLSFSILADARHGTAQLDQQLIIYTPYQNYNGSDTVSFVVTDGELADTGFVFFTILPVNDAPEPFTLLMPNQDISVMDSSLTFSWEPSSDVDGDSLYYTLTLTGADFFVAYEVGDSLSFTLSMLELPRSTPIQWWVTASDSIENVNSESRTFTVDATVGLYGMTALPSSWTLEQNFPNPFNPSTTISFSIPVNSSVRLTIYDVSGREIVRLAGGEFAQGEYHVVWNGLDDAANPVSSGLYIYRLEGEGFSQNKRMLFLK